MRFNIYAARRKQQSDNERLNRNDTTAGHWGSIGGLSAIKTTSVMIGV